MCGIAGIIAPGRARQLQANLERMANALRHRGPDAHGIEVFDDCALAHRRLSIIDLSSGAQPMVTPDHRRAVTFNGEIYGYRSLRAELQGYPWRTTSDTEVLLALYERDRAGMLQRLSGMFAFALWDESERQFLAARDRFGEKPFYFAELPDGGLVFASEIKALLASGLVKPELDRDALAYYIAKLYVPPHRSIYRNIHVLPPAHRLIWRNGTIRTERYWQTPAAGPALSLSTAAEQFADLLQNALRQQLVADVPLGAFLSGGLDSTTIVALASELQADLRTFSYGFEGDSSELPFARAAANLYRTRHVELQDASGDSKPQLASLLWRMAEVYDEPFADSSNIPTYLLCEQARRHATVVLTGDGGDELLGGYQGWYQPLLNAQRTGFATGLLIDVADRLLKRVNRRRAALQQRAARWREWRHNPNAITFHFARNLYVNPTQLELLGLQCDLTKIAPSYHFCPTNSVDDAMRMDLMDYMPGDILVKIDRASMAHGLELRAPYLDVKFAEFCIGLPPQLKLDGKKDKLLMRAAMEQRWPPTIRKRPKQGFGAPVNAWLLRPDVAELKRQFVDNPASPIFHHIDFAGSRPLAAQGGYQTWMLLVLGLWAERWQSAT